MTLLRSTLAAAALLGLAACALAQSAPTQPTVIESVELDMRSTETESTAVFTHQVVVTGTNLKLTCDRLEVIALRDPAKPGAIGDIEKFKSLVATGNVRLIQGDREATCGRAVVLPGDDKITLYDNPMVIDHGAGWTWTGDELLLLRGERRVLGKNIRATLPPVKDLGFEKDKKIEEPKAEQPKQP